MSESLLHLLHTAVDGQRQGTYSLADAKAWLMSVCGVCGAPQALVVAQHVNASHLPEPHLTKWLKCSGCGAGGLIHDGLRYPPGQPLRTPDGLPPIDLAIWGEVRTCLGSGANAAAVMLCRKLLFHIAVAHGLPPKDKNDRAPSFWEAVEHLQSEGLITPKMRPWVNRIKDIGNDANHELSPITPEVALDVATFTEQLLVLAYELDALMAQQATGDHDGA